MNIFAPQCERAYGGPDFRSEMHYINYFSVYKEFSSRACKICSERYIDQEIQFLIDVFIENGYDRKTLEKIKNDFNELHSEDNSKVVKRPWIPITGPNLRQAFKKNNIETIFRSGPNLKLLLCGKKTKLLPRSYPGVNELKCTCNFAYFGETKKKKLTRNRKHQLNIIRGKRLGFQLSQRQPLIRR